MDLYPIPNPQPQVEEVATRIAQSSNALVPVLTSAVSGIDDRVSAQAGALKSVTGRISRNLTTTTNKTTRQLSPMVGALHQAIDSGNVANSVALSLMQGQVPPGEQGLASNTPHGPVTITNPTAFVDTTDAITQPGWYCIGNAAGTQDVVYVQQVPYALPGGFRFDGPYASQQAALAVCAGAPNSTTLAAGSGGDTLPTGGGGGSITLPAGSGGGGYTATGVCSPNDKPITYSSPSIGTYFISQAGWYVIVWGDGTASLRYENMPSLNYNPYWKMYGPFTTEATGRAYLECLKLPQPPQPTVPAGGGGGATTLPAGGGTPTIPGSGMPSVACPQGLAAPGSALFCANLMATRTSLVAFGTAVQTWINSNFTTPLQPSNSSGDSTGDSSPVWTGFLAAFLVQAGTNTVQAQGGIVNTLINGYNWIQSIVCQVAPCDPIELIALYIVRLVLRIFERTRLGTDALAWATVDVALDMRELNRIVDYFIASVCPINIPSAGEAITCLTQGLISESLYECWMLLNGCDPKVWQPVMRTARNRLAAAEAMQLAQRNGMSADQVDAYLQQLGYTDKTDRDAKQELFYRVPQLSEIITWYQTGLTNQDVVNGLSLADGFDANIWQPYSAAILSQGITKEIALAAYESAWADVGTGQLLEMLHRLRPDKAGVVNSFNIQDYKAILSRSRLPKYYTDRLAEISSPLPSLRYYRLAYQNGIASDADLLSYFQDVGYSLPVARTLAANEQITKARTRATQSHGWTANALAKAYASGAANKQQVYDGMAQLGFSAAESDAMMFRAGTDLQYQIYMRSRSQAIADAVGQVKKAINSGIMDVGTAANSLINLGYDPTFAANIANSAAQTANIKLVDAAVSRVRSAFLNGQINGDYAKNSLVTLGIVPQQIMNFMAAWNVSNTPGRKRRAASQIVNDVANGNMDTNTAIVQLENLGYGDADAMLYMADANAKVAARLAKEQAMEQKATRASQAALAKLEAKQALAAAKAGKAKQAALARVVSEAKKAHNAAKSTMMRLAPIGTLEKWLKLGVINRQTFANRCKIYGYSAEEITLMTEAACNAKKSKCDDGPVVEISPPVPPIGSGPTP